VKFYIADVYENLLRNPKFVSNRAKTSGTLHEDVSTLYTFFSGDIKSPLERSLRLKPYQAPRTAEDFRTLGESAALLGSTFITCFVICPHIFSFYT